MKTFLLRLFTWWNSQTFGTQLWTWLYGEFVGEDEFGNRYYRTRNGKIAPALGIVRRWVIYNGLAEASLVPPAWHGWLHHIVDTPPTLEAAKSYRWEKPHEPNLTGTPAARRPSGSTLAEGRRPKANGDYKGWNPGNQRSGCGWNDRRSIASVRTSGARVFAAFHMLTGSYAKAATAQKQKL